MPLSIRTVIDFAGSVGLDRFGPAIRSAQPDRFRVQGSSYVFDRVVVTELALSGLEYDQSAEKQLIISAAGTVNLVFVLDGIIRVFIGDGTYAYCADSAALLPVNSPPKFTCINPARIILVSVPRAHPQWHGFSFPAASRPLASAVIRFDPTLPFLLALLRTASVRSIRSEAVASIIVKLVGDLLDADHNFGTAGSLSLGVASHRVISEHCSDKKFDAKALAHELHISYRRLDRGLADQNHAEHASTMISDHRLITAMTLLQPDSQLDITDVAKRCGFRNTHHLTTALESVYGPEAAVVFQT